MSRRALISQTAQDVMQLLLERGLTSGEALVVLETVTRRLEEACADLPLFVQLATFRNWRRKKNGLEN